MSNSYRPFATKPPLARKEAEAHTGYFNSVIWRSYVYTIRWFNILWNKHILLDGLKATGSEITAILIAWLLIASL